MIKFIAISACFLFLRLETFPPTTLHLLLFLLLHQALELSNSEKVGSN